ncbi:MAG: PhzF family phenazine biosynthesis protein [Pirellula sp.]
MKSYIVDSFTTAPFRGNPAGVCFLERPLSPETMLNITREFGLSETAFIERTNSLNTLPIRYFSPKTEIRLCGHATLAAAKVVFENPQLSEITFVTGEQLELNIERSDEKIVMAFPIYPVEEIAPVSIAMISALGLQRVLRTSFNANTKIVILEIESSIELAALRPDFALLEKSHSGINGVLVTAPANSDGFDFYYRYFWPWSGTDEDPVTGGVQTFLAKYWADKLGRKRLRAFQSSERTGFMDVELTDDKVLIFGSAVIVLEGKLMATCLY